MQWISDMFADMEKERTAESLKRSGNGGQVDGPEHQQKATPGTPDVWSPLVSAITNDVNDPAIVGLKTFVALQNPGPR